MIVELGEGERSGPFAWPDQITDFEPWDKEAYDALEKARMKEQKMQRKLYNDEYKSVSDDERAVKELARQMHRGVVKWRPTWMDLGPPVEVEKELSVGGEVPRLEAKRQQKLPR